MNIVLESRRMKILFIITGLGMGGAEKIVANLADIFANENEIKIIYLTGEVVVKPKSSNIELIGLNLNSPLHFLSGYFKIRKIINNFQPDVIHSHMFHAIIISRLLKLTIKVPKLVCSAHNTVDGGKVRALIYRITDFLADISTNVSKDAVDSFIQSKAVPKDKIICIDNGIDINQFHKLKSIKRQKNLILSVGSLSIQKDYPNLLHAMKILYDNGYNNFHLIIVGDGPLKSELIELSIELKIQEHVKFVGIRNDIPSLMSKCDIFILPSAWEGFGLVVAEAMACENIVIATDSGGVKSVVSDCGFLVPPRDSKALASAILDVINLNEAEKYQLSKKARNRIINFYSIEKMASSYFNLYYK